MPTIHIYTCGIACICSAHVAELRAADRKLRPEGIAPRVMCVHYSIVLRSASRYIIYIMHSLNYYIILPPQLRGEPVCYVSTCNLSIC